MPPYTPKTRLPDTSVMRRAQSCSWATLGQRIGLQQAFLGGLQVGVGGPGPPDVALRIRLLGLHLRQHFARRLLDHGSLEPGGLLEPDGHALTPGGVGRAAVEVELRGDRQRDEKRDRARRGREPPARSPRPPGSLRVRRMAREPAPRDHGESEPNSDCPPLDETPSLSRFLESGDVVADELDLAELRRER